MGRSDGRRLRTVGAFASIFPQLTKRRTDAQVLAEQFVDAEVIDAYLRQKWDEGHHFGYTALVLAAIVRTIALRPQLNRFVMRGRLYARHGIAVSMVVRPARSTPVAETTVTFTFTGTETVFEVDQIIDHAVTDVLKGSERDRASALAGRIMALPGASWLIRGLKWLDQHNALPRGILEVSPFHATVFFTQLKSIGADAVYHHLYNLGTVGAFVALGRVRDVPVVQHGQVVARRGCELRFTVDERICDGLSLVEALGVLNGFLSDPRLLETPLDRVVADIP